MKHIKLTKVSPENGGLEEGYTVWGYLFIPPLVGKPVVIARYKRNDVVADGLLRTSNVTELSADGFKTQNSTYTIEEL